MLGACRVLGVVAMCLQVRAESGQLGERPPAAIAFVRLLACVESLMVPLSCSVAERPVAVLALVRPLSSMHASVSP